MIKKTISLLLVGLFLTTTVAKAEQYDDDEAPKHEVSISYGAEPYTKVANDFAYVFSKIFVEGLSGGKVSIKNKTSWGVINADYNYHVLRWLALGANVSYSSLEGDIQQGSETVGKDEETFVTLMANVKMDWHRRKHITLYSRLSAGVLFESDKETSSSKSETRSQSQFMAQVSPIGIELGSQNLRFFSELGFGQAGVFQAGIRAKF